jgi:hypothetical protein
MRMSFPKPDTVGELLIQPRSSQDFLRETLAKEVRQRHHIRDDSYLCNTLLFFNDTLTEFAKVIFNLNSY